MRKKALFTVTSIVVFLFSAVTGAHSIPEVTAENENQNLPTVNVSSPTQSQIYNSSNVWLNFTVTKPMSWFPPYEPNPDILTISTGRITFVQYCLDGEENEKIAANDQNLHSVTVGPYPKRLSFSLNLTELNDGWHSLTVTAYGEVLNDAQPVVVNSSAIDFAVSTVPESPDGDNPTTLVVVLIASVIVGLGLLIYFKKRNH